MYIYRGFAASLLIRIGNSGRLAVDPPAGHCDCTGVFDKRGYFLSDTGNFIGCGNLCGTFL